MCKKCGILRTPAINENASTPSSTPLIGNGVHGILADVSPVPNQIRIRKTPHLTYGNGTCQRVARTQSLKVDDSKTISPTNGRLSQGSGSVKPS
jgi:hypothetical protein